MSKESDPATTRLYWGLFMTAFVLLAYSIAPRALSPVTAVALTFGGVYAVYSIGVALGAPPVREVVQRE